MTGRTPTTERPIISVIVATFNRRDAVVQLARDFAAQSLAPDQFEVIVVDDGSTVSPVEALHALSVPYALRALRQDNTGPAGARHLGITAARGEIIVLVDDDMRVSRDLLARHLAAHQGGRRVVFGRIAPESAEALPLFERLHVHLLARMEKSVMAGRPLQGSELYTGNVSMRRADYLAVGGFDPAFRLSEDAELGIRLQDAGVECVYAIDAEAIHASDHTSAAKWMQRSMAYGKADLRVSGKHPTLCQASPWRFLLMVSPITRPLLILSLSAPRLMRVVATAMLRIAQGVGVMGAEDLALKGATAAYGVLYYIGIREEAGSRSAAFADLRAYLARCGAKASGPTVELLRRLTA